MSLSQVEEVLKFWFDELKPKQWFKVDEELDALIRTRFGALHEKLASNIPDVSKLSAKEALAFVIVLDQFPRNMFRGFPKAFATDDKALNIAQHTIARGLDKELNIEEQKLLYMPYQHSENKDVQARSIELYAALEDENTLNFAKLHKAIVDRFGHFPHRNEILGRQSTAEEIEFLKQPGSSF